LFIRPARDIFDSAAIFTRQAFEGSVALKIKQHRFRDKLALLQKEKPLSEPVQAVVQRLLDEVLGEAGHTEG
jgi:hypothetical protein